MLNYNFSILVGLSLIGILLIPGMVDDVFADTTPTLTITNFDQYNCDSLPPPNHNQNWCSGTDHYRIDVDGITTGFAPSQPLTFKITDSNGNVVRDYSFHATSDTGANFGYEGPVFYDSSFAEQYNDSFTVTICAPEFDVCDEKSFTINSISGDTTPPETNSSPATGPFTITDDSTGGDCTSIGTWSSAGKTCTLNTDVIVTGDDNGISVASKDIILDGAGHTVSGDRWGGADANSGVYVGNAINDVVVKNFNIQGFSAGIKSYGAHGGVITGNTVSSPDANAIESYGSSGLKITNNIISNSQDGLTLWNPRGNEENNICSGDGAFVVSGNTISGMGSRGVNAVIANGICFDNNTLDSFFYLGGDSKNVVIKNNQITGSGHGFEISNSAITSMTDNTANNNLYNGFSFTDSNVITMTGNIANSNSMNGFTFNDNSYASTTNFKNFWNHCSYNP